MACPRATDWPKMFFMDKIGNFFGDGTGNGIDIAQIFDTERRLSAFGGG